ncbi:hypothetical protein PMAYCL1PPCAC_29762 [Pristionchus mayeri]|uniref:Uncharacterized protein n=1 Tax=Pristionchus mayeri TaxID=1317129 RepID=A0AAN5DBL4_9BILA|nr:hypothetical protein PMAYCL1PPCAC_29762 [Pristionchus mayeri]
MCTKCGRVEFILLRTGCILSRGVYSCYQSGVLSSCYCADPLYGRPEGSKNCNNHAWIHTVVPTLILRHGVVAPLVFLLVTLRSSM